MPKPANRNGRYMPGLDGLRAIAVLAVVAYHLNLGWAPGGLLGVGVFFVLSGYLITDLLVEQWQRGRRLDFKDFWLRRARRLLPALLLMLAVVSPAAVLLDGSRLASLRGDVLAALLYFSNWRLIFHHVSYFESFGPPSPLGHLWSLAVEEQFYALWPLVLAAGLRLAPRRGKLALLALAGAAASAIAMAVLYAPGDDPSRVYYGTDTRAFALLAGAALALVWPSGRLAEALSRNGTRALDGIGLAGLIAVLYMIGTTDEYDPSLYPGGLIAATAASMAAIAALAAPGTRLGRWLGCLPLRWLGVRSYGIYLWHYPVIVLTSPEVDTGGLDVGRALLQLAASVLLAALSWKFVEEPIRRGALGRLWARMSPRAQRRDDAPTWTARLRRRLLMLLSIAAILGSGVSCASGTTEDAGAQQTAVGSSVRPTDGAAVAVQTAPPGAGASASERPPAQPGTAAGAGPTRPAGGGASDAAAKPQVQPSGAGVTAIGDSVLLDAEPYLKKLLPGIVVDGKVGRQMSQAQSVVDRLKDDGKLGSRIVIELGTNGSFSEKQLKKLLGSLEDAQQIVLVNTRVPRKWQDAVNATLKKTAKDYPNAVLVDWYAASKNHDEYFAKDGVHLRPKGAAAYAALVAEAVEPERDDR